MLFKNIELKGIKTFVDHEGCYCHSGNIYLNKKKVGHFEDDFMCGPMHLDFISEDARKAVHEASIEALKEYGFIKNKKGKVTFLFADSPIEGLIAYVTELIEWNKEAKKLQKKYPNVKTGYLLAYNYKETMYDDTRGSYHHILRDSGFTVNRDNVEKIKELMNEKSMKGADVYAIVTDKELISVR